MLSTEINSPLMQNPKNGVSIGSRRNLENHLSPGWMPGLDNLSGYNLGFLRGTIFFIRFLVLATFHLRATNRSVAFPGEDC